MPIIPQIISDLYAPNSNSAAVEAREEPNLTRTSVYLRFHLICRHSFVTISSLSLTIACDGLRDASEGRPRLSRLSLAGFVGSEPRSSSALPPLCSLQSRS